MKSKAQYDSLLLPWATFSNKYRHFLTRLYDTFNFNNL